MNLKEKAKTFAIEAHYGQVRKGSPEIPYIVHPIIVADTLEEYGYKNENLLAAAYLHDVVEDTKYTIEDIKNIFGNEIADLVEIATEEDKSLPWEIRKLNKLTKIKNKPLESKLIICVDKINNLEDIMLRFIKLGKRDFSCFNSGEEKQKWAYEMAYKSLTYNEDESNLLFQRLKKDIDLVFNNKDINELSIKKNELKRLKELVKKQKSIIDSLEEKQKTSLLYYITQEFIPKIKNNNQKKLRKRCS